MLDATRCVVASKTFAEFGAERMAALCGALNAELENTPLEPVFQRLVRPWGAQRIGNRPRFPSDIADDRAPFEFSMSLCGALPEVQVYVDVQGEPPCLRTNTNAARALLDALAPELGASLEPLRRVETLFFPEQPLPPFALWIGASWTPGQRIRLKAYLNPRVCGADRAHDVVDEAMERLGLSRGWAPVRELLVRRGRRDELAIVSLDLWAGEGARVKVYLRHPQATVEEIDAVARLAEDYRAGDAPAFYGALAQDSGPFSRKPALTEFAFVDPRASRPASATLEYPIGSYVESDQVAFERIARCMTTFGIRYEPYARAALAFSTRPLAERAGLHAHVTLRRVAGRPRIAVYLTSEAYTTCPEDEHGEPQQER